MQKKLQHTSSRRILRWSPNPILVALKTALLRGADENRHFQSDMNDACRILNFVGNKHSNQPHHFIVSDLNLPPSISAGVSAHH